MSHVIAVSGSLMVLCGIAVAAVRKTVPGFWIAGALGVASGITFFVTGIADSRDSHWQLVCAKDGRAYIITADGSVSNGPDLPINSTTTSPAGYAFRRAQERDLDCRPK